MNGRDLSATLALVFDDRAAIRHLTRHYPNALERARRALALEERRKARDDVERAVVGG